MSVQRAVWLVCDSDGPECMELSGDGSIMGGTGETATEARTYARDRQDWHRTRDGRDICPGCWAEGRR